MSATAEAIRAVLAAVDIFPDESGAIIAQAATMNLTRQRITAYFERRHWPIRWGPEGAALHGGFTLRSGSGIAGRSGSFFLWHDRSGWKSPSASNMKQFRAITEPLAPTLAFGVQADCTYWRADKE